VQPFGGRYGEDAVGAHEDQHRRVDGREPSVQVPVPQVVANRRMADPVVGEHGVVEGQVDARRVGRVVGIAAQAQPEPRGHQLGDLIPPRNGLDSLHFRFVLGAHP